MSRFQPKNLLIYNTDPTIIQNAPTYTTLGQGLASTKCQLYFVFKELKLDLHNRRFCLINLLKCKNMLSVIVNFLIN